MPLSELNRENKLRNIQKARANQTQNGIVGMSWAAMKALIWESIRRGRKYHTSSDASYQALKGQSLPYSPEELLGETVVRYGWQRSGGREPSDPQVSGESASWL